jgi:hypothetical protein
MTTSIAAQILARLAAVLQANAPAGTHLYVDRMDAESLAEVPSITTLAKQVAREPFGAGFDACELQAELVFGIRADACTDAAETLHAAVHGPIVRDAQLQQLADVIRVLDQTFDRQEADSTSLLKRALYSFRFTAPTDTL